MKKEELENYVPKGQLEGFPKEIIARMLDRQEEQGNKRDISVFEKEKEANNQNKGFNWLKTQEGQVFWLKVVGYRIFNLFFEKYPKKDKQDNSQEFRVGDKVIYYITNKIGIVTEIRKHKFDNDIDIVVDYGNDDICEYDISSELKRPFLLHYRDDYNYDVIDFNNLPKRQEFKRWRAEVGEKYYYLDIYFEVHSFLEEYSNTDTKLYKIGNYFQTKKQAQEIADKLKEYLQELINPNKELWQKK